MLVELSKKRNWFWFADLLLIIGVFLLVIVFILFPFLCVFQKSFLVDGRFSLDVFAGLLKDGRRLLQNSLVMAFCTTCLTIIASISTALFFYLSPKKTRTIVFIILSVTMISPPFVTALSYINLFGRRGLISYHLLGISHSPYGLLGIVLMQSLSDFSLGSLILIGFLNGLDKFQIDSARNLGASTNNIILDIVLPNMLPAIKAVMLLTFLRSLSDFGTPAIIGGAFEVLSTESYYSVIAEGDLVKASAINVLLLLPAIIVFWFYQKSFKNLALTNHGISSSEILIARKGPVYFLFSAIAYLFLFWISIQYSSIILSAFTRMKKGSLVFTIRNILETYGYISNTVIRSIVYSLIAASVGSVLGILIGYYNKIRKIKIMGFIDLFATLPYIIPGTFFGLGYLLAFNSPPIMLTGTASIVVLNLIFKQLPFSTKIGNAAMEEINLDTLNSIRDLGGKQINEITDAIIPLSKHGLGVSFINGFTKTMTTMGSIIFLIYPGQKVLTLVMFEAIQNGKYGVGSVIAFLIILICLAVNSIYFLLLKKS